MPDGAVQETWVRAAALEELKAKGRMVVRPGGGRQVALFDTAEGVFACNNRCPHEGYPLSEGTLDGACRLTCNWHNWAFELKDGANVYGGDRLRVYPVELRGGEVWIDLAEPPAEQRRAGIMAQLRNAFDDRAYDRMARELGRLELAGADPLEALRQAVAWSHDRMEFGWTHAFAGAADWLRLRDERAEDDAEGRLVCLLEAVAHMAEDTLRQPAFPYTGGARDFDEPAFLAAVEAADEAAALALLRGALGQGLGFEALQPVFARAALDHYNDFGHSLIYTAKAGELIARLGPAAAEPLLLALARHQTVTLSLDRDRLLLLDAISDQRVVLDI